jgi:chromosome segregation ATPase
MNRLGKLQLLAVAFSMILVCAPVTAQTSASSTPATASNTAVELTTDQLVAKLVGEATAARALIEEQRQELVAVKAERDALKARGDSLATSYASAEKQIAQLEKSIKYLEQAASLYEKTVALLQSDNARLKTEAKKSRRQAAVATVVAVASWAARLLL